MVRKMKKKLVIFLMLLFIILGVKAEGEATLKNIKVNGKECKCNGYDCEIEVDAKSATITYELVDSSATVDKQSGFTRDLTSATTVIKVVVTNTLNGEKQEITYNITVNQHEKSGDYTLKSLKVNDTTIELLEEVTNYHYDAKYDEEKIVIIAETNDANAKIVSKLEHDFSLDLSSAALDFDVKAENGDIKTYRIVVSREEKPDTTLKSLKLDHGNIDFKSDVYEYEFTVEYNINAILVEAVANAEKASVKIEKDDLIVGENTIKIIVTNEKAESTYLLKVTREPNMDKSQANLKKIDIVEYPKFNFEENVLDYTLNFTEIPEKLTITAESINEDSDIEIIGNEDLEDGSKIIIKNTLKEPKITREYSLTVVLKKSITDSKLAIVIAIVVLIITMIVLFVLEMRDRKKKRKSALNKIRELKKKKEEEIEII